MSFDSTITDGDFSRFGDPLTNINRNIQKKKRKKKKGKEEEVWMSSTGMT